SLALELITSRRPTNLFSLVLPTPLRATFFPYTTLFRSPFAVLKRPKHLLAVGPTSDPSPIYARAQCSVTAERLARSTKQRMLKLVAGRNSLTSVMLATQKLAKTRISVAATSPRTMTE